MTINEAAKNLLDRNEITKDQYDSVDGISGELEKVSGLFSSGSPLAGAGGILQGILNTVAVGALAASLGSELYTKAKQAGQQTKSYESMLTKMPMLKEHPQDQIKDYFEVVKTFSPKSSSNPLVAGALVNKMIQFGGVDHKLVQDLASIEGPNISVLQEMTSNAAKSMSKIPVGSEDDDNN